MVREQWLREAVKILETEHLHPHGYHLPTKGVQVSVGFPKGGRGAQHSIGQCWNHTCSAGDYHEIFISPELANPSRVIDVLLHELIHAIAGHEAGHKKGFRVIAEALGLEGKMTATVAGAELVEKIAKWLKALPPYPHQELLPGHGSKKQGTRLLKVTCPGCGYLVRITAKWADMGLPTCVCGEEMALED